MKNITKKVVACILLFALVIQGCGEMSAKRSIVAQNLSGRVTAANASEIKDIVKGEKLVSGSEIYVTDNSELTLLLDSDRHIYAGGLTGFNLVAEAGKTVFKLKEGSLKIAIDKKLAADESFDVSTPNAVMSVRGTVFTVTVRLTDEGYVTVLYVESGSVEVTTFEEGEEKSFFVNGGETRELKGTAPGEPVKETAKNSAAAENFDLGAIKNVDLSAYQSYGYAYGGVIPVKQNDKWGAINYDGEMIVPCEHESFGAATLNGYVRFFDHSSDGSRTLTSLYDKEGNCVITATGLLTASSDGYVVADNNDSTDYSIYDEDQQNSYSVLYTGYRYDGTEIFSSYADSARIGSVLPCGFKDGKTTIYGNIKEPVTYRNSIYEIVVPYDFGLVDLNGNIEWIDADGINESDTSVFISSAEGETAREAEQATHPGYRSAATSSCVEYPMNAMNHGYFLTRNGGTWDLGVTLRSENGSEAWIFPWYLELDGDKIIYTYDPNSPSMFVRPDKEGLKMYEGYAESDTVELSVYFHDGSKYYNYGTKVVLDFFNDGRYALVDLAGGEFNYKVFDFVGMNESANWLISKDGKWGYCDHDGNVKALYDDACAFTPAGYALIVESGTAYIINENLEKLSDLGPAEGVVNQGEMLQIGYNGENRFIIP